MQAHRLRFLVPWGCALPLCTAAQSIEPVTQMLRLGDSLRIELRVRGFEIDPARLQSDCLSAQISQGGEPLPEHSIAIHTTPLADDGHVQVRLTSATPVHEPVVHVRARVHCGADYAREFTLLADPAGSTAGSRGSGAAGVPQANARRRPLAAAPTAAPSRPHGTLAQSPSRMVSASAPAPDIDRIAQAVAMVLWQRLPGVHELPPSAAPTRAGTTPEDPWQREIARLRDEQRQAHAQLASLQFKLDQSREADVLRWMLMAAMTVLLLGTVALRRWWTERGLARMSTHDDPGPAASARASPTARAITQHLRERVLGAARRYAADHMLKPAAHAPVQASAPIIAPPLATPAPEWLEFDLTDDDTQASSAVDTATDTTAERSRRWKHADFGHPSLDAPAHAQWLAQVDDLARTGYHGAALAVFEHALHGMATKPAWLLLRLLDLYAALDQPANHDRVAAELEALYNIRIPALHAPPGEDPALEQRADLMPQICSLWREPGAAARLMEGWLLMAPGLTRMGPASFRDTLLLHGLARELAACEPVEAVSALSA